MIMNATYHWNEYVTVRYGKVCSFASAFSFVSMPLGGDTTWNYEIAEW